MTKWLGNFVFFKNNMLESSAFCTETQILESPNPAPAITAPDLSQDNLDCQILETKRAIGDPLVVKPPEFRKKRKKCHVFTNSIKGFK